MSGDAGTWLGVIALAGAAAGAAAAVPRALWRLDRRRRHEDSAAQARAADRQAMLSRVRDKWIDGILQPSLAHTERLALDLVVAGKRTIQAPVLQMFLRTGGGLLILGAPGGGKTTLLLELADGLLERAESDPAQPVPVVASLATWTGRRQPLAAWLARELAQSYRIPLAAAHAWAEQEDLVLLLDGLDEVPGRYRESCAEAINRFLHRRPFCRMAVCCRTEAASALGTRLTLPQTVELRPAAREQVDSYLARLETTWTPLAGIRAAIAADERLRVPLMLKVAALADRGRTLPGRRELASRPPRLPAPELPREIAEIFAPQPPSPGPGPSSSSSTGDGHRAVLDPAAIWDAYVTRMLSQRSLTPAREYDQAAARRSLAWLAARLRDSGETEFSLDQLAPEARPQTQPHHRPGARTRIRELRRALRQTATRTDRQIQTMALDLARWLESRTATRKVAIANMLRDRAARARPGAWLRHLPGAMTRPAEESGWSPERVPSVRPALLAVLVLPVLVAATAAIGGWVLATIAALACGLLWGLNLPERTGMVPRPRRRRTVPDERIRRCARHAAAAASVAALASGLGLYLVSRLFGALSAPAVVLAAIAAGTGASVSNGAGACARHYIARYQLARAGIIPWRCKTFLDSMTERGLLYRSGSGYLFIHRLLADHLCAHIPINPIEKVEKSTQGLANPEVIPVALSHEPAYRADQPSSQRVSHRAQQPAGRHSARTG
ncbi:MAG: NACHT domain-containing protein [Streptosporangiaceae bacterium]|nr:NACHT domain-containing protein [Streptosporangiaceae bacterium]